MEPDTGEDPPVAGGAPTSSLLTHTRRVQILINVARPAAPDAGRDAVFRKERRCARRISTNIKRTGAGAFVTLLYGTVWEIFSQLL